MRAAVVQLPVSATEVVEFTPEHYQDAPDAPRYRIHVAMQLERNRWEYDIELEGGRRVDNDELWAALDTFVDDFVVADDQATAREALAIERHAETTVTTAIQHVVEDGADPVAAVTTVIGEMVAQEPETPASADEPPPRFADIAYAATRLAAAKLVEQLRDDARRYSPVYRGLVADHKLWANIALTCAFRRFCRGWTNLPTRCVRSNGLVTDASMRGVPAHDVIMVGSKAIQLATLNPAERKN